MSREKFFRQLQSLTNEQLANSTNIQSLICKMNYTEGINDCVNKNCKECVLIYLEDKDDVNAKD